MCLGPRGCRGVGIGRMREFLLHLVWWEGES